MIYIFPSIFSLFLNSIIFYIFCQENCQELTIKYYVNFLYRKSIRKNKYFSYGLTTPIVRSILAYNRWSAVTICKQVSDEEAIS